MLDWNNLELEEFLSSCPQMRLEAYDREQVVIEGSYSFSAQMDGFEPIQKTYRIRVIFTSQYPKDLPIIGELDGRIPRDIDYHTYPDGVFCLGSDIKIKSILNTNPTVKNLFEKILIPFLYKIVYKQKYGIAPYGELRHGEDGLIDDYERLFEVQGKTSVLQVLRALGKRKRDANKLQCPCGCSTRVGKCSYRFSLQKWRQLDKRRWFREHLSEFIPM